MVPQPQENERAFNLGEFLEECRIRFGPPMSMNPLGELTRLRQTGTIEDYCENFESLQAEQQ